MARVQLVVSKLAGVGGVGAYHTSVLLDGEEFSFSDAGISRASGAASHASAPGSPQVRDMGTTGGSSRELLAKLGPLFEPGTYDVVRKNCNTFSDCALFFLVRKRLDAEFRSAERLGSAVPSGLAQSLSGGAYRPNPRAANFNVETVIRELDPERHWQTPGRTTGAAATAASRAAAPQAMRAARLARFAGEAPPAAQSSGRRAEEAAGLAPMAGGEGGLSEDELLAQRLQEEELAAAAASWSAPPPPPPAGGPPRAIATASLNFAPQPRTAAGEPGGAELAGGDLEPAEPDEELSDGELAMRLQEEENARALGARSGRGRAAPFSPEGFLAGLFSMEPNGRRRDFAESPAALAAARAARRRASRRHRTAPGGLAGGLGHPGDHSVEDFAEEVTRSFAQLGQPGRGMPPSAAGEDPRLFPGRGPQASLAGGAAPPGAGAAGPSGRNPPSDPLLGIVQGAFQILQEVGPALNESMLQLQRNMSTQRGTPPAAVDSRTAVVTAGAGPQADAPDASGRQQAGPEAEQCTVCLEGFAPGEQLRVLPCFHRFHRRCIDPWLARSRLCPVCKHSVLA